MIADRIEAKWIDLFVDVFARCKVSAGDLCAVLSESQSRELNVRLAELALLRLGARAFHIVIPTPRQAAAVPIRSTGASNVLRDLPAAINALGSCTFVADCTVEGLMHAAELPQILKGGARVLYISDEHPDALERLAPSPADEQRVRAGMRRLREAKRMEVTSAAGTSSTSASRGHASVAFGATRRSPGPCRTGPVGCACAFRVPGPSTAHWCLHRETSI